MTEVEWEKKARRILLAFGLPSNTHLLTEKGGNDEHGNQIIYASFAETNEFKLQFCFFQPDDMWRFILSKQKSRLDFSRWSSGEDISKRGNWIRYAPVLARALCCLNYNTLIFETTLGFSITAHEKLEWQLEFQRRLREETSQVE